MIYSGDIGAYLSGSDILIPQANIFISQPTIKQISQFGENNFLMAVQFLTNLEDTVKPVKMGNSELSQKNDFQILLMMINQDQQTNIIISSFFELICPLYRVQFTKNTIDFLVEDGEDLTLRGQITPFTFNFFQTVVKELFSLSISETEEYNPANEKAKEIADKIKAGKRKLQRQRGESGEKPSSIFGTYTSILSVGMNMDINIFYNYTPFQLFDSFTRYISKVQEDFYRKISTTPFMDTSKMEEPESWMRNLYNITN